MAESSTVAQESQKKGSSIGCIFSTIFLILFVVANIVGWWLTNKNLYALNVGCQTGASFIQVLGRSLAGATPTPALVTQCTALADSLYWQMHLQAVGFSFAFAIVATGGIFVFLMLVAFFSGNNSKSNIESQPKQ